MNVLSCHAYNGGSVIVWAGVTADRRTDLVVIRGTLNSQRYIDEVLLPHVLGGARWLSGRVSDSGARGRGFETYPRRVVSLSKTLYSPTQEAVAPSRYD